MTQTIRDLLSERVARALAAAGAPDAPPVLQPSARPEFGDYQANGVMGAAKRLGMPPRELAAAVLEALDLEGLAADVAIAGPGFLNITLTDALLASRLNALRADVLTPRSAEPNSPPVVVDYSSPNLAKSMHVGHLRSTIIGDAITRTLEHRGERVLRQNHVGDWGTQFGMLLTYLDERRDAGDADVAHQLDDLEGFYRAAKARFDSDPAFKELARANVVRLQSGDPEYRQRWAEFIDISMAHCDALYARLGVTLTRDDVQAESAYNDDLAQVVEDLTERGLVTESEGALCVFLDEFTSKDGTRLPLIVRKQDGGFNYATTDLAAVRHRVGLGAQRSLYVVDKRQSQHFQMMFAVARAAGFLPGTHRFEHIPFGMMLGEDGRPFRTRSGDVVKLSDLLDEAQERAYALVREKNTQDDDATAREIARIVGIGAVKYADLAKNRTSDYVFSWDTMLSFEGNTAPYLQYACSRIRSLTERAAAAGVEAGDTLSIDAPAERALALSLVRLPETLEAVVESAQPHLLCTHLYDLAVAFTTFYEQCPVLSAEREEERQGRLALATLTGDALRCGLGLLGIEVPARM